jgi:ribose transport system ATP-binding protein
MSHSSKSNRSPSEPGPEVFSGPNCNSLAGFAVEGIQKRFPGVQALDNVAFGIRPGEVHALVGENGAGKSTLLKILSGALQPDTGIISISGEQVVLKDPKAAVTKGIATIYQELSLVPWLSIARNLFLGREKIAGRVILSKRKLHSLSREILEKIGVTLDPDTPVIDLGVAEQQLVEIARALSQNARFILMDEPTASLTEREIEILFQKILTLKNAGVGILYISHRLEEIDKIADRVTVMRDGAVVHTGLSGDITLGQIITKMVGRSISNHYPKKITAPGDLLLEIAYPGEETNNAALPASFHARAGEVVGLAGLVGAGRTEWARRIFGADPGTGERIRLFDKFQDIRDPSRARDLGLGMVPENRKDHGIILGRSVKENITVTILERICNFLDFVDWKKQSAVSREYREKLSIRCPSDLVDIGNLSGGNQQKAVLAKWLACEGRIIILDEPTRGIDVGAKLEMYNLINDLCAEGKAVILISSDLPELLSMSDRIYIMHRGAFVAELSAREADQETVMQYASGIKGSI